jgi:hypothetical protein
LLLSSDVPSVFTVSALVPTTSVELPLLSTMDKTFEPTPPLISVEPDPLPEFTIAPT